MKDVLKVMAVMVLGIIFFIFNSLDKLFIIIGVAKLLIIAKEKYGNANVTKILIGMGVILFLMNGITKSTYGYTNIGDMYFDHTFANKFYKGFSTSILAPLDPPLREYPEVEFSNSTPNRRVASIYTKMRNHLRNYATKNNLIRVRVYEVDDKNRFEFVSGTYSKNDGRTILIEDTGEYIVYIFYGAEALNDPRYNNIVSNLKSKGLSEFNIDRLNSELTFNRVPMVRENYTHVYQAEYSFELKDYPSAVNYFMYSFFYLFGAFWIFGPMSLYSWVFCISLGWTIAVFGMVTRKI
jgi:hypothetical protein